MSKSFDFNAITQQTLETKLGDITLHLTTPPERMIEQLAASVEDLTGASVAEQSCASYNFVAELMSCNVEGFKITGDELRDKYNVAPVVLAAFVTVYMDFINDFHNAKN